jgi:hypothetical protein
MGSQIISLEKKCEKFPRFSHAAALRKKNYSLTYLYSSFFVVLFNFFVLLVILGKDGVQNP